MSVELAQHAEHAPHEEHLAHQFEDRTQQDESYIVGMWTFLVTEIMFFGGLFLAYLIYRYKNPEVFVSAHEHLNVYFGGINTLVLLTSSLFMALAVRCAQLKQRGGQILWLLATIAMACVFLVIKGFEYKEKFDHHLFPGPGFRYEVVGGEAGGSGAHAAPAVPAGMDVAKVATEPDENHKAEMFFNLYFAMTGLHGIHVLIGIIVMGVLAVMIWRRNPAIEYYMPVEMAGLYWHFVDIVWIFLFPLFYLIPR
jgi:cytochrome c oxidase subunit 3